MLVLLISGLIIIITGGVLRSLGAKTDTSGVPKNQIQKELMNFLGLNLIFLGSLLIAAGFLYYMQFEEVLVLFLILLLAMTVYTVLQGIQISKGGTQSNLKLSHILGSIVFLFIFIILLMLYGISDPQVIPAEDHLIIRGAEGLKIPYKEFKAMKIDEFIPTIFEKESGWRFRKTYRGLHEFYKSGPVHLYIDHGHQPYIYIFLDKKMIAISRDDKEEAKQLYEKIKGQWYHYLDTKVVDELRKKYKS